MQWRAVNCRSARSAGVTPGVTENGTVVTRVTPHPFCGPVDRSHRRYHVARMAQSMILLVVVPSESGTKRVRISVPLIECLLDHQRYFLPGDLPPPAGEELRPMSRPRITKAPRAPSLRSMVKLAVRCQSAEELGQRLKRRYQRQRQRAGTAPPGSARDEDELARILGDPVD